MTTNLKPARKFSTEFAKQFPLSILIVEDDAQNQFVLNATLEALGYAAKVCSDGLEAVDILEKQRFDCLIIDLKMPRMSGFELGKLVRERALTAENFPQPVAMLALTANILSNEESQSFDLGFDAFVAKPFRVGDLRDTLQALHARLSA